MKTWLYLAGMVGIGSFALFGGSAWFSSDEPAGDEGHTEPVAEVRDLSLEEPAEPAPPPAPKHRLTLQLPPHQSLPLLKTVEQVLVQKTRQGDHTSQSSLELAVALRLEETAQDGSQRISVEYQRVRYRQDVGGRSFVYDSSVPARELPVEALPYQGLVGNGFSFWIGPDHRLIRAVGFADFLKRCVQHVPPAQRQRVLSTFANAADAGVVDFIEDSLDVLPPSSHVQEEQTWKRQRRLTKPIPLVLETQYTLKRITGRAAEIDIAGSITTPEPFARQGAATKDLQVIVQGGHTQGHCELDPKTGLPLHSEIKSYLDMEVQMADGRRFDQKKITTTTVRLLPRQTADNSNPIIHAGGILPENR